MIKTQKFYSMTEKILLSSYDGSEPPTLFQRSHSMLITHTGKPLVDYTNDDENGEPFKGSLMCDLDYDEEPFILPTFFLSPGLISTQAFYEDLVEIGIDNLEVHPVIIRNHNNDITIDHYLFLNILGRISCVKTIDSSEFGIYASKVPDELNMFMIEEDPSYILVKEHVYIHIKAKYPDIFFDEIPLLEE